MFIYLRDRESVSWGEAEREGDRGSEAGSAWTGTGGAPCEGLELTNPEIMT